MSEADRVKQRLRKVIENLKHIEFACHVRYGAQCPACHGMFTEDYGYTTPGPDEGHEKGCWLKAAIRSAALHTDDSGSPEGEKE